MAERVRKRDEEEATPVNEWQEEGGEKIEEGSMDQARENDEGQSSSSSTTTQFSTTSSLTKTTTTQCLNPGCAYGQSFDSVKCVCNCFSGFSGPLCGVLDCNLLTDAFECSLGLFTCLTPEEVGQCPNLCGYYFFI